MITTRNEIIFVDSNLTDYQTLLNNIPADAQVHIIDGSSDGLQQMLAFLTGCTNINAIHVLGHGSSGALKLGNLTLNSQNIEQYKTELQQLGQKLTTDGDLLFYGCNVAQGDQGQTFIKQIADFTQADVTASNDLTGNAALGGNWELETHIGSIETQALTIDSFSSVLVQEGGAATIQQGTDTSLIRYDLHNYFQATEFQFSTTLVPIISADTGATGADIVFQCKVQDGQQALTVGNWYTWTELQTLVPTAFPSGQATDNGPLDKNNSSSVLDFDIAARIDWNNANLPSTLTFTLGGSRNYTIGISKAAPANTAPVASNTTIPLNEGSSTSVSLSNLTTDAETASSSLSYSGTGVSGTSMSYTAPTNAALKGTQQASQITYIATDSGPLSATGTVTFNVTYFDDAPTGTVTATGTSRVSQTLTATNTISDIDDGGAGVSKSYQWQYYNTTNNAWTDISGATASTFAPTATEENKLVRVKITAGSPSTIFTSDVRFISPANVANDPGVIILTGLPAPITISQPAGDVSVTNDNPNPATNTVTLDGPDTGTTVTTLGNGPITVANPQGGVTVINNGTGTTTVTGTGSGNTVTPQGSGSIVIVTSANPSITIDDSQPAADLTITNTGTGTVSVTPVGDSGTVKIGGTSTGAITLSNPASDTTVTNNGTSVVTVNNLVNAKTVTSNGTGSGSVTVANPSGDVTLKNDSSTSSLSTSGVGDGKTVITTGTNSSAVNNPSGNVRVNNTSTGTVTVSGITDGKTVTAQGTGSIIANSVLNTPNGITIDATANQNNVTVDNDGTGSVSITGLIENGLIKSTGSGTGSTTVTNPTGSFTINNTGANTVSVTGFDDTKTLTITGSGAITVNNPDGNATINTTGTNTVTLTGVLDGKTITTTGTGGSTVVNDPTGDLTVHNTSSGNVSVAGFNDGKTITTTGTQPITISSPDGNLTVVNTGTGLDTVTGLLANKTVTTFGTGNTTVSSPAGNLTLNNTGTGALKVTGAINNATVTSTGTTATTVDTSVGDVVVNNTGTGVVTVTGTSNAKNITTQGTGAITVNSVLTTGNAITVNAAANQNLTLDNDNTGTITVTGVTTGSTIKNTGDSATGITNINNPTGTGTLTVENTGVNPLRVTGLDTGATLTNTANSNGNGGIILDAPDSGTVTVHNIGSNTVAVTHVPVNQTVNATGTGLTNVDDPSGNVTLHNTGSGELRATGVNNGASVNATGTTSTTVQNPDGNVTVNNTGTGVTTVNAAIANSTVTTQGTGAITVHSELLTPNGITVAAANNTHLTVDNDGTGSVNVTGVTNGSTIHSTGIGTGTTTVVNPTGNLTVDNTGSNRVTVTGFDTNKTITTTGTGSITVDNPDGNVILANTGSGTVVINTLHSGNNATITGSGPVNVTAPAGNANIYNNGTGLVTTSGVTDGSTIHTFGSGQQTVDLSGLSNLSSVTIDNSGTGLINLTNVPYGVTVFFTGTAPITVSSFSGDINNGAAVLENLSTSLVTVANDTSGVNGGTVKSSGTGPIKFDTDVANAQTLHVNIADNTNVTFDNDGAGTLDVTGVPDNSTLTSSSSGSMTVTNPTGNLTVNNSANGSLNVTGFDNDKTLTLNTTGTTTLTTPDGNLTVTNSASGNLNVTTLGANKTLTVNASGSTAVSNPLGDLTLVNNGSGSISVDAPISEATITTNSSRATTVTNPAGNLTVANTGTGTVSVAGINNSATLIATGSGATNITSPDADASFTVANNGTGLMSVSGIANGKTITTVGTGQIAITTALGTGEKIIIDSANNNDIQITNTGAGLVDVQGDLALDSNDAMAFTLTGNHTTVMSETGILSLGNAPLSLNLASGYTPVLGDTITLIGNDDADPLDLITGIFANKAEGSTIQVGNYYFKISYVGGTGNDVVLTATGSVPVNNGGGGGGDSITSPIIMTLPPVIVTPPQSIFEKPVSRDVESQVPSASGVKGDGNGDGITDVDQRNVISLPTQKDLRNTIDTPKVFLSIELPQGQILTKAEVKSVAEMTKEKPIIFATETLNNKGETVVTETTITKETAPFGLFEFNFANVPSTTDARGNIKGGTTDVKLYLDDKQTVEKYLKQTVSGTWEQIPFTYVYDAKLGKTIVSISLTDGDKFDLDGKIDGGIFDPGTPIITPKLTAAPIPVALPAPIEKVFMGYGSAFELTSGAAQIFGSSMREVLALKSDTSNVVIDQNVEQVNLAGKFVDYTFEQQGNSLKVINNSTIVAKVFVQDDSNGTLLGFADGLRSASFNNATIFVTDKIVPADDIPLAILQKAGVYLSGISTNPLTVGGNSVNVYGSLTSTDTIGFSVSTTNATIDANVEQVNFVGKFADYGFVTVGNSLDVLFGESKLANIVIQDDSNGIILNFADQSYSAHFVTSAATLQIEITGISPIL